MTAIVANLPVPSSNAAGAAVDVSQMGATKTIIVGGVGGAFNATVTIEFATSSPPTQWAPVPNGSFVNNPGRVTVDIAAQFMRAVTTNYKGGSINADVAGQFSSTAFAQLAAAPGSVDISAMPNYKTVVVSGPCNVEVSEDGVSWSQAFSFQGQGAQSATVVAMLARITNGATGWMGAAELGDGSNTSSGNNIVFRPGDPAGSHDGVYTTWEEVIAAAQAIEGFKTIQVDTTYEGAVIPPRILAQNTTAGGSFVQSPANPNVTGTVTFTDPAGLFTPAMVGTGIRIQGATTPSNNGEFIIKSVISPTQVTWTKPVSGAVDEAYNGHWIAGGWDMTDCELWAVSPGFIQAPARGSIFTGPFVQIFVGFDPNTFSIGDCFLAKLRKIGGEIGFINLCPSVAPLALFNVDFLFEAGTGTTNDFPLVLSAINAPTWDTSGVTAGNFALIRNWANLTGPVLLVGHGASDGEISFRMFGDGRVGYNLVRGSNPAGTLNWNVASSGSFPSVQPNFAGTVSFNQGIPDSEPRMDVFPPSLNSLPAAPFTTADAPLVTVMNGAYAYDSTTGNIAQVLPKIRAAAAPTGTTGGDGVIESKGLIITATNQAAAVGTVTFTPSAGDMINGGAVASVVLAAGQSMLLLSDGISNWRKIV